MRPEQKETQGEWSETKATMLAAVAWSLSTCALFESPGVDRVFRLAPVIAGILTALPAMLLTFLEPYRQRSAKHSLVLLGAVVLGALGISYVGSAEPWRLAFAYLVPSAMMAAGSLSIALPSARHRIAIALREMSASPGT